MTGQEMIVIGFGNEGRQDDGLGPAVARRIEALRLPNVRVLIAHQLTPELSEPLAAASRAYFVDAHRGERLEQVAITPVESTAVQALASHDVDPAGLLSLARAVYGRAPRAWLVTIAGNQFEHLERLSPAAEAGAELAVRRIAEWLCANGDCEKAK